MGRQLSKKIVVTSDGKLVAFSYHGTESPNGVAYSVSTDNGSTWSAPTSLGSANVDFSIDIDSSNNIFVAYSNGGVYVYKLTYNGSTWSKGSETSVTGGGSCLAGAFSGDFYSNPAVTVSYSGKVFLNYVHNFQNEATGCSSTYTYETSYYDSSLTTQTIGGSISAVTVNKIPAITDGRGQWAILNGKLYADVDESGSWKLANSTVLTSTDPISLTYGLDELHVLYKNGSSNIVYRKYSVTTGSWGSETVISSAANDIVGAVATDSHYIWAAYLSYVATNSYNVVYKQFNGSGWSSANSVTADNLNNRAISLPHRAQATASVPITWISGTASPYTIKGTAFSGVSGTVTDSGNMTGTLTGSLTGSSGDVIVKCGVWYYNTINIVAGMTVKVCSSNGVTGGKLELHANSVTIAGTIDGAGRGSPGGISVAGTGGGGGVGAAAGGQAGGNGSNGQSYDGGVGTGLFGGSGGTAGTSGSGGTASLGSSDGGLYGSGTVTTTGNGGSSGGYNVAGSNNDTSTDESLSVSSGGGAGGTGGSGGGGAGGHGGSGSCAAGGGGGNGGAGGQGGKGGNAGAQVKIYSAGTLSVTGFIYVNGQAGGNGSSGSSGSNGIGGSAGGNTC